jgi:hypothetical protein
MRMTPALVVLTLAVSTASVAAPVVSLPGRGPHAVRAEVLDLTFSRTDLTDRRLPDQVTDVAQRVLTPAAFTKPFSLVGLTWDLASAPDPVTGAEMPFELSVRTRQEGTWTAWEHLHADSDAPDSTEAADLKSPDRAGTAPVWVGESDALQVRLDRFRGELPTGLRALLIDPGASAADADVGSPQVMSEASAAIAWPTIHRRREWGADERLRDDKPRYNATIKGGFVHHTAGTNDYSPADVPKMLRGIYAYHVRGRGWSDVGYNFIVDKFGRVWEGRAGGVEKAVLGAHTGGFNRNTFAVSALGNFEKAQPSPAMLGAISRIFAWKFAMYGDEPGLRPLDRIKLLSQGGGTSRYRAGKTASFVRISGHRDAGTTACPGKNLYAQLPTIRALVATILDTQSTHGPAVPMPVPIDPDPVVEPGPVPASPAPAAKTAPKAAAKPAEPTAPKPAVTSTPAPKPAGTSTPKPTAPPPTAAPTTSPTAAPTAGTKPRA